MKLRLWLVGIAVLAFAMPSFSAAPPAGLGIWDFELGITNAWGGRYNVFTREPSWARTYLDPSTARASSGHSLRVTVHRQAEGFCGVWMDLHSPSEAPRRFLDATPHLFLSFWVKGQTGGEQFELWLTDDSERKDEGARETRSVRSYLPDGVTTEWQEVLIPLADFRGVDLRRLVHLTLHFTTPGDYRFFLDDIALKRDGSAEVPASTSAKVAPGNPAATSQRAMWVWNTKKLLDPTESGEVDRFFAFCSANAIRTLYLAMEFNRGEGDAAPRYELREPERYQAFLERAHRQGLAVEGLAGTPEWGIRENHPHALAAVDAALAFNRASPASARFDGVHFDVEPYALIGYSDPEYRTQILEEFLEMVTQCAARVRAEPGLRFSCDVPAWFYPTGGLERQRLLVNFRGGEKTVGEHLTDVLDEVTIMDYTNQADGTSGIIARGLSALDYAASQGKRIVVGLETFAESDREIYFLCGLPSDEFRKRLKTSGLRSQLFLEDLRMSVFSDEINLHMGLAAPLENNEATRAAFEEALVRLARQLSASCQPDGYNVKTILEEARAALAENPEWKGFETFELTDPETKCVVTGFRSVHPFSPRITFRGLGRQVFEEETRSTVEWLGRYPSFAGIAIHFYESFRELVEGD